MDNKTLLIVVAVVLVLVIAVIAISMTEDSTPVIDEEPVEDVDLDPFEEPGAEEDYDNDLDDLDTIEDVPADDVQEEPVF